MFSETEKSNNEDRPTPKDWGKAQGQLNRIAYTSQHKEGLVQGNSGTQVSTEVHVTSLEVHLKRTSL